MFKSETNNSELEELKSSVERSFVRDFIDCLENECKTNKDVTRAETILENTYVIKIKMVVGRLICYGEKISCNYHKVVVLHGID